ARRRSRVRLHDPASRNHAREFSVRRHAPTDGRKAAPAGAGGLKAIPRPVLSRRWPGRHEYAARARDPFAMTSLRSHPGSKTAPKLASSARIIAHRERVEVA